MTDAVPPPQPQLDEPQPPRDDDRRTSVLIVDDHAVVREGLRRILDLRDDIVVVGEADGGDTAIELAGRRRPDLVVFDDSLPGPAGRGATRRFCAAHPDIRVVVFTERVDAQVFLEARAQGAAGIIGKDADSDTIADAISRIARGEIYIDPRIAPDVRGAPVTPVRSLLSVREQQVLQLLADGCTNREVGQRLMLGSETVKTHVAHILSKLNAAQRSQAVAIGIRDGLIR